MILQSVIIFYHLSAGRVSHLLAPSPWVGLARLPAWGSVEEGPLCPSSSVRRRELCRPFSMRWLAGRQVDTGTATGVRLGLEPCGLQQGSSCAPAPRRLYTHAPRIWPSCVWTRFEPMTASLRQLFQPAAPWDQGLSGRLRC